jgi:hypothetical protein
VTFQNGYVTISEREYRQLLAQRDRLADMLDLIASSKSTNPMVWKCHRDMAKVGVVEVMRKEGREWLDELRRKRGEKPT